MRNYTIINRYCNSVLLAYNITTHDLIVTAVHLGIYRKDPGCDINVHAK